jgi:hypothetical protein
MHNILADQQQNHFDMYPNPLITQLIPILTYFIFSLDISNFNFKIIDTFFQFLSYFLYSFVYNLLVYIT